MSVKKYNTFLHCILVVIMMLLSSCVLPIPLPKSKKVWTTSFSAMEAYTIENQLILVDTTEKMLVVGSLEEFTRVPYDSTREKFSVIKLNDYLKRYDNNFSFKSFTPIPIYKCYHDLQYYTLGDKVLSEDEGEHVFVNELEERKLKSPHLLTIYSLASYEKGTKIYLVRSKNILSNGDYSAIFKLKDHFERKIEIVYPLIYPDTWEGSGKLKIYY